jgi:hypothetical protein
MHYQGYVLGIGQDPQGRGLLLTIMLPKASKKEPSEVEAKEIDNYNFILDQVHMGEVNLSQYICGLEKTDEDIREEQKEQQTA